MPHFTTSDNCRLYYETHGLDAERPAIVFLNGTTQTTVHWRPQVLQFRGGFRILLYDGRAQGRSELGPTKLSLERHCRDLNELMGHLKLDRAHLVGLSHGAQVALALAAENPQKVEGLLICGLGHEPSPRARAVVRCWLEVVRRGGEQCLAWTMLPMILGEKFLSEKRAVLEKMAEAVAARNHSEALAAHFEALLAYPPPAHLAPAVRSKGLVVSGSEDLLVRPPAEEAEGFNRALSRLLTSSEYPPPFPS